MSYKLPTQTIPDTTEKKKLSYKGQFLEDCFTFSFSFFDKEHKLFNLGDDKEEYNVISGCWFLVLLECLKKVSEFRICDLKSSMFRYHPVDWEKANVSKPKELEHLEFYQFRLNKSKGRVLGFRIGNVFYIVWLDPHHNFCDSPGYEKAHYHKQPLTDYEIKENIIAEQRKEIENLKKEIQAYEEIFEEKVQ